MMMVLITPSIALGLHLPFCLPSGTSFLKKEMAMDTSIFHPFREIGGNNGKVIVDKIIFHLQPTEYFG